MKSVVSKNSNAELIERVLAVINKRCESSYGFGRVVGISNMWRKVNGVSPINENDIRKICDAVNVNKEWLKTGAGEMGDASDVKREAEQVCASVAPDANRVPYYDIDFTCSVKEVYNDDAETPTGFVSIPGSASADFCCRTSGDSMAPYIMRGDIVAMKKIESWSSFIPYNEVYGIVTTNGLRTIKVVRRGSKDGKIILHSYNSDYEDQEIDAYTIVYMYKVMAIARVF